MCPSGEASRVKRALESVMGVAPEWADGLPLAAESVVSEYYTKTAE
jgi:hypothetical protein